MNRMRPERRARIFGKSARVSKNGAFKFTSRIVIPRCLAHLVEARALDDRGVVHEHVGYTERGLDLGRKRRELCAVAQVAAQAQHARRASRS